MPERRGLSLKNMGIERLSLILTTTFYLTESGDSPMLKTLKEISLNQQET